MKWVACALAAVMLISCNKQGETARPAILLITLDTTRADAIGGEATPHLNALMKQGRVFSEAYAPVPMTLPSHTSMFSGLYASEHGVRENARYAPQNLPHLPTLLKGLGYENVAVVSAYPLAGEFGLARGFDIYDEQFPEGKLERTADQTTKSALGYLENSAEATFLWVHYFDAHHPYSPPEPFKTQYAGNPYHGEIAFMDQEAGRLIDEFRVRFPNGNVLVVGDHGEGLGEHGEQYHGNLVYNSTVHAPLMIAGPGIESGVVAQPVSIRRVYHTIAAMAGGNEGDGLLNPPREIVMGEAMKPFLQYGWSPQVFAVDGRVKYLKTGQLRILDLDHGEASISGDAPAAVRNALESYALPGPGDQPSDLSPEQLARLASLGYSASTGLVSGTSHLPEPSEMTHLFSDLDLASDLFVRGDYPAAIEVFDRIYKEDPSNPSLSLRQAVAHSVSGNEAEALTWFRRAGNLMPDSTDLHHFLGMHYMRFKQESKAAAEFELVLQRMPNKIGAIMALAGIREREGALAQAIELYGKAASQRSGDAALHQKLGHMHMAVRNSSSAIAAFEKAQVLLGDAFGDHLELGVCYMDLERFQDAAYSFDRVPPSHPGYDMARFKRAQVSVLLGEPDAAARIDEAENTDNERVLELIRNEPLFRRVRR